MTILIHSLLFVSQFSSENEKKINQTEIMPNHVKQVIYNGVFFLKKLISMQLKEKKMTKLIKNEL